jgi:hypothetical protein
MTHPLVLLTASRSALPSALMSAAKVRLRPTMTVIDGDAVFPAVLVGLTVKLYVPDILGTPGQQATSAEPQAGGSVPLSSENVGAGCR